MADHGRPSSLKIGLGPRESREGLGTFLGVFTPTILTILGVIMYLRFGWVVGQVGLLRTLLIVLLANSITLITAFSLSAVATNSRTGVGGAYFMISRSLGLEIGGAIGVPLYLSQALSVTLYAFGLAESLRFIWPEVPVASAAFAITILVAGLAFRGAAVALKAQIPIMILIGLSLCALASGLAFKAQATGSPAAFHPVDFWAVFAVFFPAVTGVMAGLSLSGDLRDPRRSIPRGSILATLAGLAVYLVVPVLLSLGADPNTLREDPLVWTRIAALGPWLVLPGLWGAIFSSAVSSMLGAPRTLQALAADRLAPAFLKGGGGKGREPVAGMAVTLALSLAAVFLGDLNRVATVVTMFFLSVYGTVNLVAALEKLSGNPSWRPTLNIPWYLSLAGAFGCLGAMMLIHLPATGVAVVVELGIWFWLRGRSHREVRGDVRRDLYEALIRWALVRLSERPMTARNWRPHMLIFTGNVEKGLDLVRFGSWFGGDRGVVTVCELVSGNLLDLDLDILQRQREIDRFLKGEGIVAFGEVNVVQNLERGILAVAQANGMAGIESNTLLVGWPEDSRRLGGFLRIIRRLRRINRSLIIGRVKPLYLPREGQVRSIHVWWGGLKRNGDLMMILAYLLTCNREWRQARIVVNSIASSELMKVQTETFLGQLIPEIRIEAEVDVMVRPGDRSVHSIMLEKSAGADVVLLGLAVPEEGEELAYVDRLRELSDGLPTCFFVHNGSLFVGDLVTPEKVPEAPREGTVEELPNGGQES